MPNSIQTESNNTFLIGKVIIFTPDKSTLELLLKEPDEPSKKVSLGYPASRCLLLLIKKRGQIVNQDEFFKEVWQKNGTYITLNTLYQNISILRKAFKKLGIQDDIIITIPKMGVKLLSSVEVLSESNLRDTGDSVDHKNEEEAPIIQGDSRSYSYIFNRLRGFYIIPVFIILLAFLLTNLTRVNSTDALHLYTFNVRLGECLIYTQKNDNTEEKFINDTISISDIDCSENKFLYFSMQPLTKSFSIVQCHQAMSIRESNNCSTILSR